MAWLEITVKTEQQSIEDVAAMLTAAGFDDLVLEDQTEFESFLDENRAYWDYIDESLQQKLQGLSQIKLYLEETDEAGQPIMNVVFQPDENGVVAIPAGTTLEPMTLYPYFEDAT